MIRDLKEAIDIMNAAIKEGTLGVTSENGKHFKELELQRSERGHMLLILKQ